ncbi:MAG: hypothetical protein H0U67_06095, partial [Gemmatimonadetes bacterium]|nr:hypothetical protein [Gemmatimonadota bacterium]
MTIRGWFRSAPAALLSGLLLVGALATTAVTQADTGTVRIRVESHGTALAGAEVRAGRTGVLTDAEGRATLRLPAGTHTIAVR